MSFLGYFTRVFNDLPGTKQACMPIKLEGGVYIDSQIVQHGEGFSLMLSPPCPDGSPYIYDMSRIFEDNTQILTAATQGWQNFYRGNSGYASSLPVFVSIVAIAMTIVFSMAVFMTVARHSRFPWTIRIAVYYATAEVIAMFGIMLRYQQDRFDLGGNSVSLTTTDLVSEPHHIASYVAKTILDLALVQVTVNLFVRKIERGWVAIVGFFLVVTAAVLNGTSAFGDPENEILSAFHYMLELPICLLFTFCLCIRTADSFRAAFSVELIASTIGVLVISWIPPAFYIADVYGWWQARIVDDLCPFSTVMCVVSTWYWIQKLNDVEQGLAESHQLGRRILNQPNAHVFRLEDDGRDHQGLKLDDISQDHESSPPPIEHPTRTYMSLFSHWFHNLFSGLV